MKLEHGKRYVTRSGMITPPLNMRHGGISFDIPGDKGGVMLWAPDGVFRNSILLVYMHSIAEADRPKLYTEDLDLVAEYVEPAAVASPDATDADVTTVTVVEWIDDVTTDRGVALDLDPFHVTQMMIEHGGDFVKQLAHAYRRADDDNARKLRDAFQQYWEKYSLIYRMKNPTKYRGWKIEFTGGPSGGSWAYVHDDYDGTPDGNDHRFGYAPSFLSAVDAVNEWIADNMEVSI